MTHNHLKFFAIFVIVVVLLIDVGNFINQMHHADSKEFWSDEEYSLQHTVRANSYLGLLAKEAVHSEANAAPLDYIVTKILDDIKSAVGSFGISDKIYYRLWANLVTVFSGFVIVCLFARDILRSASPKPIQMFQLCLLMLLPFVYLYRPLAYHYAAEVRPYALWFALWFISMAVCSMARINKIVLAVCLSLLAITMVGSIFQILAVAVAYGAVQWRHGGWKQALKDTLQVVTIPFLLVVFYAFPASYGGRTDEPIAMAWERFFTLWGHEAAIIPMLLAVIILLYLSRGRGSMSTGPLAVLIIFLMGPLIFFITVGRGYFFAERQYIYYDAHRAVFWLGLINVMPFYLEKIKNQKVQVLVMVGIFAICMPFVFPKKTVTHIKEAIVIRK